VRVGAGVAELEGEVDGDGLVARLLVPGHVLHVLVEPGVATAEGTHRQRAKGEGGGRAALLRQARRPPQRAVDSSRRRRLGEPKPVHGTAAPQQLVELAAAQLRATDDALEERLVVDILIEVLVSLPAQHRLPPRLHHRL